MDVYGMKKTLSFLFIILTLTLSSLYLLSCSGSFNKKGASSGENPKNPENGEPKFTQDKRLAVGSTHSCVISGQGQVMHAGEIMREDSWD